MLMKLIDKDIGTKWSCKLLSMSFYGYCYRYGQTFAASIVVN